MKTALALLLLGCSATSPTRDVAALPVTIPAELEGTWCADDLCLTVASTSYGPDWDIYSWISPTCREGGFLHLDDHQRLMFGGIFPNAGDCLAHLTPAAPYEGTFTLRGEELTAQFSVQDQPIVLLPKE